MENKSVVMMVVGGLALGSLLGAGASQAMQKKADKKASQEAQTCSVTGGAPSENAGLFSLNGKTFSQADLPAKTQDSMFEIQSQSYEQLSAYLKEFAVRLALAEEQGKAGDLNNLPDVNTLLGNQSVSEEEVKAFYESQKARIPPNIPFDKIKPQIVAYLSAQKNGEVMRKKVAELEQSGKFKMLIKPPVAPAVSINTQGYPSKGSATAPNKLIIVTDFLCSHCRDRAAEFAQLTKDANDKLQVTRMIFSLNKEGLSGALARGAYCAQQQGDDQYWKYHEKAEAVPFEAARAVSPDAQKEFKNRTLDVAKEAGLDVPKFDKCMDSKEAADFVTRTNDTLTNAGVNGTPTVFLNGRKNLSGPGALEPAVKEATNK